VIGNGPLAVLVTKALRAVGAAEVSVAATPSTDLPEVVIDTTGGPAVVLALLAGAPTAAHVALAGKARGRKVDVVFYRRVDQRGLEVIGAHDFGRPSGVAAPDGRPADITAALLPVHEVAPPA
jgi:hypothetical protein